MSQRIVVIMSLYKNDQLKFVQLAVESVLNQTYSNFDFFIQYDGPINKDVDIYLTGIRDERIKIQRRSENKGLAHSLNDLLKNVMRMGYKYIARMDADDICEINRFKTQQRYLQSHPEVDVVGGKIEEINENGVKTGKSVCYPLTHKECLKFFRYRDPLAHPASFFRKRYFDKLESNKINNQNRDCWYRVEFRKNQDTMLWFDGFMSGCVFANVPETVLNFRVDNNFYCRRKGWKRARQMLSSRRTINKALNYDITANLFAIAMAIITISPSWLLKFMYKIR